MQIFEILTPILLNTAYVIAAFFIAKYAFVSYFFALHKNEITSLSSQISSLKLNLKARLTHKFNNVETFGNKEITSFVIPLVNEIKELHFQDSEDYQTLIKKMIEIVDLIKDEELLLSRKTDYSQAGRTSVAPEFDSMKKIYSDLFEFDKGIVALIIEIYRLHADYVKALRDYNKYADIERSQKLNEKTPEPILIENFYLLEDIYTRYKKDLKEIHTDADAHAIDAADSASKSKAS